MVVLNTKSILAPNYNMQDITGPNKLSFVQALIDKYVDQEEFDNTHVLPEDSRFRRGITYIGFKKVSDVQRQLKKLVSLDLSGVGIEEAGSMGDLPRCLTSVQVLNLSNNHLRWNAVLEIISCMPGLRELILSNNRLEDTLNFRCPNRKLGTIKSLILGRVNSSWSSIVKILDGIWMSVDLIDLWDCKLTNDLMHLDPDLSLDPFTGRLQSLKLSYNQFDSISWITRSGCLNNLHELDVSNCHLTNISIDSNIVDHLANLKSLNLSYNDIYCWSSISCLHHLKRLKNLLCHENPFYISQELARPFIIAALGKLDFLNREKVTPIMRRDSEVLYLRKLFPEYNSYIGKKNERFAHDHPRYLELVEKYGIPEDLTQQRVKDKFVNVYLSFRGKIELKKLPLDMRISNLKMFCKRSFRIKPSSSITLINSSAEETSYALDQDGQTLDFFSVKNNDTLTINES